MAKMAIYGHQTIYANMGMWGIPWKAFKNAASYKKLEVNSLNL